MAPRCRFHPILAVLAACGVWAASCARGRPSPPVHTFEPAAIAAGERLPLLIFLHGLGGSGQAALDGLGLADLGRRHRVIVVAPDGTPDRQGRRFWNAGGACCDFDGTAIDDVGRLAALIDLWRRRPEVDPRRVYLVGFSNGGFMAHRLACRIGDRLAAVASLAGAGPEAREPCRVSAPIGVLEVHGDADPIVRYTGGRVLDSPDLEPHPSAPETVRDWGRRLGCSGSAAAPPPGPGLIALRYQGCRLGATELWTVRGGDHQIATPALLDEMWGFLSAQVKPGG